MAYDGSTSSGHSFYFDTVGSLNYWIKRGWIKQGLPKEKATLGALATLGQPTLYSQAQVK